jgi:hypothetical protein
MPSWLDLWKSQYPYASSLYGVYQPLIGWKSRRKQARVDNERIGHIRRVVASMIGDQRYVKLLGANPRPLRPDEQLPPRLHGFLGEMASQGIYQAQLDFLAKNQRPPIDARDWQQVVGVANLPGLVTDVTARAAAAERALMGLDPAQAPSTGPLAATGVSSPPSPVALTAPYLVHESVAAGVLHYLSTQVPTALAAALRPAPPLPLSQMSWVDPLAGFDPERQLAFLSPVGPMQLYRQYFFELDTLLGPPVGHVWVSPGGSLELYEVHTLRSIETRDVQRETSSDTRTETQLNTSDELASAVTNQNSQNLSMGVSVNAGVNMAVWHASTTASFDMKQAKQTTDQETHKTTRAQTQKASSEVRQNFKTDFKTTLDQTDQISRRYVLSNTTSTLVNYELRRKMRRVAVQLQHIGTRLCWQVYVDDPAIHLGIAELVHVATPFDSSNTQPPTAPATLAPQEQSMSVPIPFVGADGNDDRTDDYVNGGESGGGDHRIVARFSFTGIPPAAGYKLQKKNGITLESLKGTDNPSSTDVYLNPSFVVHPDGATFDVHLDQVNFDNNHELTLNLRLVWLPPDQSKALADYRQAMDAYNQQVQQEQHAAYVQSVRDRLDAASSVKKRPSDDLREEERVSVYRALLKQLVMAVDPHDLHATSELIRSVFDLDSMLYFVAPDYWKPRRAQRQQLDTGHTPSKARPKLNLKATAPAARGPSISVGHAVTASAASAVGRPVDGNGAGDRPPSDVADANGLGAHDLIAWGGERDRRRDNYLITETTDPAPYGASLGWMIQLDGDERRNAFLNSPWVKAVIPILPGHEQAAINWLGRDHVEGSDGFKDPPLDQSAPTIKDALLKLAAEIAKANTDPATIGKTERVFETGFDPLAGGVQLGKDPYQYEVFDQWIEVMPTDQVVAIDYTPPPVGPPSTQVPTPAPVQKQG